MCLPNRSRIFEIPDRSRADAFPARGWIERMLAGLRPGARILDLGCGGGEPIARHLHDHGFAVTGVDLAASQIDLARTRFPSHRWIKHDMRTVMLDGAFDGVIAWDSLSWLDHGDQARMATRAADWLSPDGLLLFNIEPRRDTTADDYRTGTPYRPAPDTTDYTAEITQRGLALVGHAPKDAACGNAAVWLARKPAA